MNKETFGIELDLVTSKFNQKMESIKSKVATFGKTINANFKNGMYIDTTETENKINSLQSELNALKSTPYDWNFDSNGNLVDTKVRIKEIENELSLLQTDLNTVKTSPIAKIGQAFSAIKAPIQAVKSAIDKNKESIGNVGGSIEKSFSNGIKSIKRFALSLVGVQSIWRLVSRASSAYLAQDTQLSAKLQASWVALGSMLAPILNNLANFFIKMVSYLNIFIKAMTGGRVDLLANSMNKATKSTNGTTSAVKELKGQLSGFDEINNIADDSSDTGSAGGTGSADTSWMDTFNSIKPDTSWTQAIQGFGEWMQTNWPIVTGLLAGTILTIELIKLGVGGLLALGIGLALAGIVTLIISIIQFIKNPSWANFSNILVGLSMVLAGIVVIMIAMNAMNPLGWILLLAAGIALFAALVIKNWDSIWGAIQTGCNLIAGFFSGLWNGIVNLWNGIPAFFTGIFQGAWNGIVGIFNAIPGFFSWIWSSIVSMFTGIGTAVGNAIGSAFAFVVNSIIGFAEDTINGFIRAINLAIGLINMIPGVNISKLNLLSIPRLNTGTNYVPSDQLAYIHQGEAVVPKKFNSSEYFGRGNEETNELLRQVIEAVNDKDLNTYLDSKVIGQTAQKYINNQSRVMGRSLV